jgi:hypothetical protein
MIKEAIQEVNVVAIITKRKSKISDIFPTWRIAIPTHITNTIPQQIELQLDQKLAALDPAAPHFPGQPHFSRISAWLETTQWTSYLRGHGLRQAAALIKLSPSMASTRQAALNEQESRSKDQLRLLLDSFDRVIEQARSSLLEDWINVFDQHQVNSCSFGAGLAGNFAKRICGTCPY